MNSSEHDHSHGAPATDQAAEHAERPRRHPGTSEGTATFVESVIGQSEPRGGHPGAHVVLENETAKVVAFEFGTGDELKEHAAHHPVIIQILRGRVRFTLPDRELELAPGALLHLTPQLRHAVTALEPTTLTVTMLSPHA